MPRWGNGSALPFTCCPFRATLKPVDMYPPHSTRAHASGRKSLSTAPEHVRCLAAPLAARPRLAVSLHVSHLSKETATQDPHLRAISLRSRERLAVIAGRSPLTSSVILRRRRPLPSHQLPSSALERTFALSVGISSPRPSPRRRLPVRVARLPTLPSPGGLERRVT